MNSNNTEYDYDVSDSLSWSTSCGLCLAPLTPPPPPSATGSPPTDTSSSSIGVAAVELHRVADTPTTTSAGGHPDGSTRHRVCVGCAELMANNARAAASFSSLLLLVAQHPAMVVAVGVGVDERPPTQTPAASATRTIHGMETREKEEAPPGTTTTTATTTATGCASRACVRTGTPLWSPLLVRATQAKANHERQENESGTASKPTQLQLTVKCPICDDPLQFTHDKGTLQQEPQAPFVLDSENSQSIDNDGEKCCPLCDEKATQSCSLCGSILCGKPQCVKPYTKMHMTMGHSFTPVPIESAKKIIKCPDHNRPLELFCTQDNTPVCSLCVLSGRHQDSSLKTVHPTVTIYEAAKGRQATITRKSKELEEKVKTVKDALDKITETKSAVRKNCSEALKAMDEEFVKLEALLEKRHKQLAVECMNIADSTERIMDMQQEHLERFVGMAEAALKSADKLSHTSRDFGVIRSFDSSSRVISELNSQSVHLKPCCKSELNFTQTMNLSETINSFGALTFGVSTSLSKFKVMIPWEDEMQQQQRTTAHIAGRELKCTVECTSLVDETGTPIPSETQIPSLMSAGLTVLVVPLEKGSDGRVQFEQSPCWKKEISGTTATATTAADTLPKCEVSLIPKCAGKHSLVLGGDTELFSLVSKEIDPHQTKLVGCLNGTPGNPFKLNLITSFSDGSPVISDNKGGSSQCCRAITPEVMQTRFRVCESASVGQPPSSSNRELLFTKCDKPDEVEFTVQRGGEHHLFVETAAYPNIDLWVPVSGCPFSLTVIQVDISKCRIENVPSTLLLQNKLSLPIQLMNTGGQPIPDVDCESCLQYVEWRAGVTPPTAAIVSIGLTEQGSRSTVVVVNLEAKVVMDNVVLAVEGLFSSSLPAQKVWQNVSGSPFTLKLAPPQARKIGSVLASSTHPGYPPERVIDYSHDQNTYWLSQQNNTTGQFLVFDLTEPCVVPVVCFRDYGNWNCSPKDVTVSVGDSSTGPWTTLSKFTAQIIDDWQRFPVTINASTTPHRWVRLFFDSNHGSTVYVVVSGVKFWD
ncbi:hypothetical protein Pelo_17730 [Pelomyxa schiedti]|nr:hypothetical protein Pelo_17730 [Pelomyxa schiedti]